jgi:hypothetical protein
MLKKLVFAATAFLVSVIIFQGCVYHKGDEQYPFVCDTTHVQYSVEIKAILDQNCATINCHEGPDCFSGYNLYDYETISGLALDTSLFTDGLLLAAVMHEDGLEANGLTPMPKDKSKLQDCDINKIAAWVHNGAPDN